MAVGCNSPAEAPLLTTASLSWVVTFGLDYWCSECTGHGGGKVQVGVSLLTTVSPIIETSPFGAGRGGEERCFARANVVASVLTTPSHNMEALLSLSYGVI